MHEYYGWRAKIGLIYIASSTVMEPEWAAMAPEGVSVHVSRISLRAATTSELLAMLEGNAVERCASELAEAPLDAVVFGCTSGSFLKGSAGDTELIRRISNVNAGVPATTTSTASIRALQALGVRRIALATPYIDEVTERARGFFEEHGFQVNVARCMGLSDDHDIANVTTELVYDFVRELDVSDSDAVFISCTNLRTAGALAPLESALGRPVVSAIQASLWDALRLSGVDAPCSGFGRLMERPRCGGAFSGRAAAG